MSSHSHIQWTEATWSPTVGCTHVSTGCDNCYAATLASGRLKHLPEYAGLAERGKFNGTVRLLEDRLTLPLKWRKPRMIFVDSMSDLFHESVPDEYLAKVFAVMALAPRHTFQILTKRHARMRSLLNRDAFRVAVMDQMYRLVIDDFPGAPAPRSAVDWYWGQRDAVLSRKQESVIPWPLPCVWLGVSAEDQHWANIRIPALLDTPAAVRFVSAEPLLGPIDFEFTTQVDGCTCGTGPGGYYGAHEFGCGTEQGRFWGLDWVIVGGESGRRARPMQLDWARSIRDQCQAASVAFFYKQQGTHGGVPKSYRELDGRTWDEYPEPAA